MGQAFCAVAGRHVFRSVRHVLGLCSCIYSPTAPRMWFLHNSCGATGWTRWSWAPHTSSNRLCSAAQPAPVLWGFHEFMWCNRRHALELGAARAEQTAAWLNTHVFMPPAERAEWAHLVSHLVLRSF